MNGIIKILLILTILTFLGSGQLFGQNKVGTTSFQFLKVEPGTRAAALGQSTVSIIDGAESLFSNPAGISTIKNYDIQFSHIDWFSDTKIYSAAIGFNLGYFSLGAFGAYWDYGQIEVTDPSFLNFNEDYTVFNPGLTGEVIYPSAYYFGLSVARSVTDKFNFGISLKYAGENFKVAQSSVLAFDGGMTYNTGFKSIKIGGSLNNFGLSEVTFLDKKEYTEVNENYDPAVDEPGDSLVTRTVNGESFPIPQIFTFGVSANLIAPDESLFLNVENISLLIAYQIQHPRDYDMQHNVGLEFSFMDFLLLRGGYKFNYDEESITFGFGLDYKGFTFGYAYDPFGTILEEVHRISIAFSAD